MADTVPTKERLCLWCEHCFLETGYAAYSELTPGEQFDVFCTKRHWKFRQGDGDSAFRTNLLKARSCPDWKLNIQIADELKVPK